MIPARESVQDNHLGIAVRTHGLDWLVPVQHRGHDVDHVDIDRGAGVGDGLGVGGGWPGPAGGGARGCPHLPGLTLLIGEVSGALGLHSALQNSTTAVNAMTVTKDLFLSAG